jgi:hypothetical protein
MAKEMARESLPDNDPIPINAEEPPSTIEIVRSIASDTTLLVRKEVQLAKQELMEAVVARLKAAGAMAAAGALAFIGLIFAGSTVVAALDRVMPAWAARLVVTGGLFALAGAAVGFGLLRIKKPSIAPEETVRTVKEDVEWARAQLKR